MKKPPARRRHVRTQSLNAATRPRGEAFRAFVAYSDVIAARRALVTIGDAMRTSGRNLELHPMMWRFAQLESSHWSDRAVTAALDADIVVLASTTPAEFSPAVEQWAGYFLAAASGRRTTIVAITGTTDAWTISIEQPQLAPATARCTEAPADALID